MVFHDVAVFGVWGSYLRARRVCVVCEGRRCPRCDLRDVRSRLFDARSRHRSVSVAKVDQRFGEALSTGSTARSEIGFSPRIQDRDDAETKSKSRNGSRRTRVRRTAFIRGFCPAFADDWWGCSQRASTGSAYLVALTIATFIPAMVLSAAARYLRRGRNDNDQSTSGLPPTIQHSWLGRIPELKRDP